MVSLMSPVRSVGTGISASLRFSIATRMSWGSVQVRPAYPAISLRDIVKRSAWLDVPISKMCPFISSVVPVKRPLCALVGGLRLLPFGRRLRLRDLSVLSLLEIGGLTLLDPTLAPAGDGPVIEDIV